MAADVKRLVERMQGFYERTADFRARFKQDYTYASFGTKQASSGEVLFKKPGYMRWDYRTPAAKTFVTEVMHVPAEKVRMINNGVPEPD